MRKDILQKIKASVLSKKETKTIVGGYDGSFGAGNCSFIICGGDQNKAGRASKPGCPTSNGSWSLYVYRPNPSLYCWG
ncbi:hypothetical protein D1818_22925 [Aquimarina sp. BL5]|uniref:hypothetical protein n=1 Tax=Aquimarina sp. BL5 TaxID=1714860 RepID=UPI000E4842AB|nr:hypothetical protein [Aquimarina sp. BL5]AXT53536.1 hypothetical protein D1818_22925 [Aquimarina sp. BL5]RKN06413.1 hypothetical protein D7036_09040 [Aquimarina sp. BL5]